MALLAGSLLAISPHSATKTVTTAGTAVPLFSSSTLAASFTVQAMASNTGTICLGDSAVLAASKNGTCLTPGQAAPLYAITGQSYDLSQWYIDASANGQAVGIIYVW